MTKLTPLKMKRIQAGITQEEMAKRLGITYQAYNYKENSKEYINNGYKCKGKFNELEKREICRILNCGREIFDE